MAEKMMVCPKAEDCPYKKCMASPRHDLPHKKNPSCAKAKDCPECVEMSQKKKEKG